VIPATLRARARHEGLRFAATAGYLYVCFGALVALKSAILHGHGLPPLPLGLALVKALLLAKFMMVGDALRLGERYRTRPLIWPILHRSVVFLALLVGLTVAEAVVAGWLRGRAIVESLRGLGGGTWAEAGATLLVLLLILLPYFAFRMLAEVLGPDRLFRVMFVERRDKVTIT
jgi:hypothetical protein